jgi:hypothetical protein
MLKGEGPEGPQNVKKEGKEEERGKGREKGGGSSRFQ